MMEINQEAREKKIVRSVRAQHRVTDAVRASQAVGPSWYI
jgi:hypothetical protein